MTPGEIAARYGGLHSSEARGYLVDAIRAAIAERDQEWVKALLPVAVCVECNEAFGFFAAIRPECRYCAPLRTLLAAGEERTE